MNDQTNETSAPEKKRLLPMFFVALALAVSAGGAWFYFEKGPGSKGDAGVKEVVARVNGVEIGRDAYERNLEQMRAGYVAQGIDVSSATSSEMLKQQAIDALVNRQLVAAAAKEAGLSVETSAVDAEYQNLVESAGGAESFATALQSSNLSEEMVRADLAEGLLIQQYLSAELHINELAVSDAEVETYYNGVKSENPDVPALADVSAAIKSQLLAQKQEEAINTALQSLRASAQIEILI